VRLERGLVSSRLGIGTLGMPVGKGCFLLGSVKIWGFYIRMEVWGLVVLSPMGRVMDYVWGITVILWVGVYRR
jgi:hypothetical protein